MHHLSRALAHLLGHLFLVAGRSHHRVFDAAEPLPNRSLAPLDDAFRTQPVADRLEGVTHLRALLARLLLQVTFCRAHWTSSFTDSTVVCGTICTSRMRSRARWKSTKATIA